MGGSGRAEDERDAGSRGELETRTESSFPSFFFLRFKDLEAAKTALQTMNGFELAGRQRAYTGFSLLPLYTKC